MLIVALILVAFAVLLFLFDAWNKGKADVLAALMSLGLASGFAGIAAGIIHVLQSEGKL